MDPVSHVLVGRLVVQACAPSVRVRGTTLATVLGTVSPDIDFLLMPTGWDRYLALHECGTHALAGAVVCGLLASIVATGFRRWPSPSMRHAAMIAAASHVAADVLSGARIRVGWPVWSTPIETAGLVAMGDPYFLVVLIACSLAVWLAVRRDVPLQRAAAAALIVVGLFLSARLASRVAATQAYLTHTVSAPAVRLRVNAAWGTWATWRIDDATRREVRAWSADAVTGRVTPIVAIPLEQGMEDATVLSSRDWSTVRRLRHSHRFTFALRLPAADGARVVWSDVQYCWDTAREGAPSVAAGTPVRPSAASLACALWFGGDLAADGSVREFVSVGDWIQRR